MRNNLPKTMVKADDEMLPEYVLQAGKGVRNKYAAATRNGYTVHVLNEDGTTSVMVYPPTDVAPAKTRRGRTRNGTAKKARA